MLLPMPRGIPVYRLVHHLPLDVLLVEDIRELLVMEEMVDLQVARLAHHRVVVTVVRAGTVTLAVGVVQVATVGMVALGVLSIITPKVCRWRVATVLVAVAVAVITVVVVVLV
jgi:hypothetical protein